MRWDVKSIASLSTGTEAFALKLAVRGSIPWWVLSNLQLSHRSVPSDASFGPKF